MNERTGAPPDLATLAARLACYDVVLSSVSRVDDGAASQAAELYTADAVITRPTGSYRGREEIDRFFQERERSGRKTRHLVTNFSFELIDAATAAGTAVFSVFELDQQPFTGVAARLTYTADQYRYVEGRWRIAQRHMSWLAS